MTPEDKKIWEEVAKTIKPLKKKKQISSSSRSLPKKDLQLSTSENSLKEEKYPIATKKSSKVAFMPKIMLTQDRFIGRKLRQGTYRIQSTLDLHGHTQKEAYSLLQQFLKTSLQEQLKLVMVITGKGSTKQFSLRGPEEDVPLGVLRQKVPQWLENSKEFPGVLSVSLARPQDGGAGALYIELKSKF